MWIFSVWTLCMERPHHRRALRMTRVVIAGHHSYTVPMLGPHRRRAMRMTRVVIARHHCHTMGPILSP